MVEPAFKSPWEGLNFLRLARRELMTADSDSLKIMQSRDTVLAKFGPLFRERAGHLSENDIEDFLDFEKNCHWTGLHRQKTNILQDLPAVRKAIAKLVNRREFEHDLEARFNFADRSVKGFGEGIISPILFVAHPEHYGVWNSKSEFALKLLGLWITSDKGDSKGRSYEKVNAALIQSRNYLNSILYCGEHPVDLWSIDYYWHAIKVMHDDGRLRNLITTMSAK